MSKKFRVFILAILYAFIAIPLGIAMTSSLYLGPAFFAIGLSGFLFGSIAERVIVKVKSE